MLSRPAAPTCIFLRLLLLVWIPHVHADDNKWVLVNSYPDHNCASLKHATAYLMGYKWFESAQAHDWRRNSSDSSLVTEIITDLHGHVSEHSHNITSALCVKRSRSQWQRVTLASGKQLTRLAQTGVTQMVWRSSGPCSPPASFVPPVVHSVLHFLNCSHPVTSYDYVCGSNRMIGKRNCKTGKITPVVCSNLREGVKSNFIAGSQIKCSASLNVSPTTTTAITTTATTKAAAKPTTTKNSHSHASTPAPQKAGQNVVGPVMLGILVVSALIASSAMLIRKARREALVSASSGRGVIRLPYVQV